jgi:hypothetical protein
MTDPTPRQASLLAGVSYVLLFALGIFANFVAREQLVVGGDPAATAANIADAPLLFRFGMLGFLAIFVLDVVVAWALYILFRPVASDVSLVSAWFRLAYTIMLGVALVRLFRVLQLLDGADFMAVIDEDQRQAQALIELESFNSAWLIGLTMFGFHLIGVGRLIQRSGWGPAPLAWILMVAGAAYIADTVAHTMLADYARYEDLFLAMVAVPAVIGEGWFGLWLLLRGGRNIDPVATTNGLSSSTFEDRRVPTAAGNVPQS